MRVVGAVAPHVRERELSACMRKHPSSMTAYDLTLQALDHVLSHGSTIASCGRASCSSRRFTHDPDYAPGLFAHWPRCECDGSARDGPTMNRADPRRWRPRRRRMAIERDRNDALGLAIYGHLQSYLLKDYDAARNYLERALTAGPSCAWAWAYSSLTCGYLGRRCNGIAQSRAGGATVAARCGRASGWSTTCRRLLPRPAVMTRRSRGAGCRLSTHRAQHVEPALPDRKSGGRRRAWMRLARWCSACCNWCRHTALRFSARERHCAVTSATCSRIGSGQAGVPD